MRPARRTSQGWQVKGKEGTYKRVGAKTARKLQTRAASQATGRNVRQAGGGWQVERGEQGSGVYGRAGGKTSRRLDAAKGGKPRDSSPWGGELRSARRQPGGPPNKPAPGGARIDAEKPRVKLKGNYGNFVRMHGGKSTAALAGAFRKRQGMKLNKKMKTAMAETAAKRQLAKYGRR